MADAHLIEIDVDTTPSGLLMGTSRHERGLHVAERDLPKLLKAAAMMLEAIAEDAGAPVTALPVAGQPTQLVLVPRSPASAARLLLESPEAVERMARANPLDQMAVAMADADGDTLMVDTLVRAIVRRALRSIAGDTDND